jgi:hypothetical protein
LIARIYNESASVTFGGKNAAVDAPLGFLKLKPRLACTSLDY